MEAGTSSLREESVLKRTCIRISVFSRRGSWKTTSLRKTRPVDGSIQKIPESDTRRGGPIPDDITNEAVKRSVKRIFQVAMPDTTSSPALEKLNNLRLSASRISSEKVGKLPGLIKSPIL